MKVVVILPTYNERENIVALLDALHAANARVKKHDIRYLVVDDSSPDGTKDAVEAYRKTHKDTFIVTGKKEGLGKALLRGMTQAVDVMGADIVAQMDADLSHDPEKFPDFLAAIDDGADFAVGSRYIPGGSIPENWGAHRKVFSVIGNAVVRYGLGYPKVHDWTGGYRAYRKQYYELAKAEMREYSGYVFQIAFLHKAIKRGAKVAEVPIHFTDRRFGHSKIAASEYIRNVFLYVGRERYKSLVGGTFFKFAVVGGIGFIINTVIMEGLFQLFGIHPSAGSAIGAECAIISNFILNNAWTFGERKVTGVKLIPKFLQFNVTAFGGLAIQSGAVAAGTFAFGVGYRFPFFILGVGFGLIWNYIMYSKVIWKKTA